MGETAYAARRDPTKKPELFIMRRVFAQQAVDVAALADTDPGLKANSKLATEFRRRLSEMRSGIALNQAKWPTRILDNEDPEFHTSADAIIKTNREFAG